MNALKLVLECLNILNKYFTDIVTVVLLLSVGAYFTIKTRFVQVRCFKEGIRNTFKGVFKKNEKSGVTPFSALATAVGSQVGIGNIIGVSAAIIIGGAGSVFWMWVSAFLGMATIYTEAVTAQKTRQKDEKGYFGGPTYYIKRAFRGKLQIILPTLFSLSAILALGCSGAMIQSNAIAKTLQNNYSVPTYISGILLGLLCLFAFTGGVNRIAKLSEKIVVVMAIIFLAVCTLVLLINIKTLPHSLKLIFVSAFKPSSITGYGIGEAIRRTIGQGVKKGLFSNEAGLGTTPHIYAAVDSGSAHSQGVVAMMGVFVDSFVIMTTSALVMITVIYGRDGSIKCGFDSDMNNMMLNAVSYVLGSDFSKVFMSFSLFFFGYSSIISWNYFGRINFEYLFGKKSTGIYILFSVLFIFAGCIFKSEFVWSLSEVFNNFLILPNIIALVKISKKEPEYVNIHKKR